MLCAIAVSMPDLVMMPVNTPAAITVVTIAIAALPCAFRRSRCACASGTFTTSATAQATRKMTGSGRTSITSDDQRDEREDGVEDPQPPDPELSAAGRTDLGHARTGARGRAIHATIRGALAPPDEPGAGKHRRPCPR